MNQETEPDYGNRLIIDIINEVTAKTPSRPFVYVPKTSDPRHGWIPLSYKEISDAIDHLAWKITQNYGPGFQGQFPTLAYLGTNDIRYIIVMLACIKAGYQALFLSPRNNKDAQQSLLQANDCRIFWYTRSFGPVVEQFCEGITITKALIPSVDSLVNSSPSPFPYHRTFDQGRWDPAIVLHTSGSTGFPKSIVIKQGTMAIADAYRHLPEFHGSRPLIETWTQNKERFFLSFPLFHVGGLMFFLVLAVFYDAPVALSIPTRPLSDDLIIECLEYCKAEGALLVPALLEEMSKNESSNNKLSMLKYVGFGGGSLSQKAGQTLAENGVVLSHKIGSTEWFPYPLYFQTNIENWPYFVINSELMGCEWRLHSEDENLYELVFRRIEGSDPSNPGMQAIFYTFPHLDEWSTGDLYKPHPTLPNHWENRGRVDDIIVFSNGEKLNPISMEGIIVSHPSLKGALVVGRDRFQPALILEPTFPCESEVEKKQLIEDVWPLVEEANEETVAHGRLVKWLVIVTWPQKPLQRAPKRTILRQESTRQFKDEIESLYQSQIWRDESINLEFEDEESLTGGVIDLIANIAGFKGLEADTDFFGLGFDSLQVLSAARIISAGLQNASLQFEAPLPPRIIYENSTPRKLSAALLFMLRSDGPTSSIILEQNDIILQEMLHKYTLDLPCSSSKKPEPLDEKQTIIVTGTAGSLGSYLLDQLCNSSAVQNIIALNRGEDGGRCRQVSMSGNRGLGTDFSKVEFLEADLSLPDFGLGGDKYKSLLSVTDRIIHNAWPVNFNIGLASFEPHVRGVRHLVDFSGAATKQVPIIFLSTISTVVRWDEMGPVPEKQLQDFSLARLGYGQSKLVSSLILDFAAKQGIPTASVRIGQIAGSKHNKGIWNPQEYIPSLIASSVFLGALPIQFGPDQAIDWVPIEDVASLVLDVSGITTKIPFNEISGYFHAVNPHPVDWSDLVVTIMAHYEDAIQRLVSFEEWVLMLEKSAQNPKDIDKNPGIKLLDTYRDILAAQRAGNQHVSFCMQRTAALSPTVAQISEITPSLMTTWCDQWGF